ncbi:MAG: hypothetical protein JW807_09840 [Spirochaetes bacterium]|nr:hypothetical protein [Spirochaetota bacterium]
MILLQLRYIFVRTVFSAALLAIVPVGMAYAAEGGKPRPRIAVVDFIANNADPGMARIVKNAVEMNLFRDGSFDILEQSRINDLVKERKLQIAGCRDAQCATKIGELLKGDYVIIGSLDRLDRFTVNVKVVSVKEGKIIFSESRDAREPAELRDATAEVARMVAVRIKGGGGKTRARVPIVIDAEFVFSVPIGYLAKIAKFGYGAAAGFRIQDVPVRGLLFGLNARFIHFDGRDMVRRALMAHLLGRIGYAYTVWHLSIVPRISAGTCYIQNTYYSDLLKIRPAVRRGFQPMVEGGVAIEFNLPANVLLGTGADYGAVFEKGGTLSFFSIMAGFGIQF